MVCEPLPLGVTAVKSEGFWRRDLSADAQPFATVKYVSSSNCRRGFGRRFENSGVSFLNSMALVARNMRAAKTRTAIVIIAVAVVVGLLFSTLVIELGVRRSTEIGSARLGADILLFPSPLPDLIIYIQWKYPVFITPTNATAHLLYLRPSYIDYNATLDREISTIPGIIG